MAVQNVVLVGPLSDDEIDELMEAAERDGFDVIGVADVELDDDELDTDELDDVIEDVVIPLLAELLALDYLLQVGEALDRLRFIAASEGWPTESDDDEPCNCLNCDPDSFDDEPHGVEFLSMFRT